MPNRLWRIYREEPTDRYREVDAPGLLEPAQVMREVYLTTLSASSADAALTRYEQLYGEPASYAIADESVDGGRVV